MTKARTTVASTPGKVLVLGGYLVLDHAQSGLVLGTSARFYTAVRSAAPTASSVSTASTASAQSVSSAVSSATAATSSTADSSLSSSSSSSTATTATNSTSSISVSVESPQFTDPARKYRAEVLPDASNVAVHDETGDGGRNPFIETALHHTLQVILQRKGHLGSGVSSGSSSGSDNSNSSGVSSNNSSTSTTNTTNNNTSSDIEVSVVADIDFYSQRAELQRRGLPTTTDSLRTLAKFTATRSPLRSVNKTGLGSSAAMTTSVVAALLHHFGVVDLAAASAEHTALVHNVAQLCHCLAQGKIGSGFDVSAAVYGSHIYRRFSPQLITAASDPTAAPSAADIARLADPSATAWDCQVTPFALPKGLRLVMADVEMGSNTPSMASKVLKWRREHPDQAEPHWHALAAANERAWQLLGELGRFAEEASYADVLRSWKPQQSSQQSSQQGSQQGSQQEGMQQQDSQQHGAQQTPQGCAIGGHLQLIHDAFQAVRRLLKQMGDFAGVPIEPDAQTALLDACIASASSTSNSGSGGGVLAAGVPGAGGYDAIFCIIADCDAVQRRLETLWSGWQGGVNVCPLLSRESSSGIVIEEQLDIPFAKLG